ncbi:MAG: bile acid:sodium symporter family protein, partial [Planctomycetes bacterium]|nr:bile acid:sodium symporter family protein [Planctomycetota bacterium]
PKLVEKAKGDVALAVSLMVLMMVCSLVYLPLVLPMLLPGVSVDSEKIALKLFITMILPLSIGLMLNRWCNSLAIQLSPWMDRLSSLCLITAVVLIPATSVNSVRSIIGSGAILGCLIFLILSFAAGFLLGGPSNDTRRVLGFGSAARNIPSALIVGGQNFTDPNVVFIVLVVAFLKIALLIPLAAKFAFDKRR